jgi:spore germination protein KA
VIELVFYKAKEKIKESQADKSLLKNVEKVNMELNSENVKSLIDKSSDVGKREIYIAGDKRFKATIFFIDGLIRGDEVGETIIKPLVNDYVLNQAKTEKEIIELIEKGAVYFPFQNKREDINLVINDILSGQTAIVFDNENIAITFDTKGFAARNISEPTSENVYKGSKDVFVETIRTNTATVRRKIRSKDLIINEIYIGKRSLTPVAIVYIESIANQMLVDELKRRLENINEDAALTTSSVEEYIIDKKYSFFPQVLNTERPDKFGSYIIEGGVGLIIDGIPFCFIVPATLNQVLQAPEDYSNNYIISSFIRIIRYIGMIIGITLPALYISVVSFNQVLLPPDLALSVKAAKLDVPFNSFMEIIIMLIAFEMLQEAGIRLPKTIGQTISIVGALIIGQAATEAKIVSPVVVIVIAFTAIADFTMPNQDFRFALRACRFILVILSSLFGLVGLMIGVLLILYQLSRIESYGVPYLYPYVGSYKAELEDSLFRYPQFLNRKRPRGFKTKDKVKRDEE